MGFTVSPAVWEVLVGAGVALLAWCGVALTALTLPGIWLAIGAAGLAQWWSLASWGNAGSAPGGPGPMFSWWTLGVCVGLGLLAELTELLASAVGARKMGGTKKGALGSVVGGVIGAISGAVLLGFIPVVGSLLGAVLGAATGAGVGALLTERHLGEKTWSQSGKIGAGAAVGRLVASLVKVGFATVIALTLSLAAFF